MKLQQQSHATLKSKLQDHKTIEESVLLLCKGKGAISFWFLSVKKSHQALQQWNKQNNPSYTCCTVVGFSDEMETRLLMSFVYQLVGGLSYSLVFDKIFW